MTSLTPDQHASILSRLKAREEILEIRLADVGPERLAELDETKAELLRYQKGVEDWDRITQWRADNDLPMNKFVMGTACAESEELIELRERGLVPSRHITADKVPEVLSAWLTKLHAVLVAYPDRIELRGRIRLDVDLDDDDSGDSRQPSQTGRGLG
jgi:hypothetical protein